MLFWPQAAKWQRLITVSLPSPLWITLRACSQELTSCSSKPTTWIWWSWAQKRTIQVSDKHISVSHMHKCLLISGQRHGSDDPDHEQNNPSVWQTHFSQSYAQVLTYFRPTTWIRWSWAWTEQAECLTNTFQSVICATAYSFLANHKCTLVIILYANTCHFILRKHPTSWTWWSQV